MVVVACSFAFHTSSTSTHISFHIPRVAYRGQTPASCKCNFLADERKTCRKVCTSCCWLRFLSNIKRLASVNITSLFDSLNRFHVRSAALLCNDCFHLVSLQSVPQDPRLRARKFCYYSDLRTDLIKCTRTCSHMTLHIYLSSSNTFVYHKT